ncbi:MAG TPA: hypothetical protein VNM15_02115 [Candidatus Binatia bacterium]|nr:hypothetical protein [Candidatus Binatia bacterium]
MKRLFAIAIMSFLLLGGMVRALADCLGPALGVHGRPQEATIASPGDLSHPEGASSAKIHCAKQPWPVSFFLRSSGESASRQLGKNFAFANPGVPRAAPVDLATPPKAFLISPLCRAPIYIDASVLRI